VNGPEIVRQIHALRLYSPAEWREYMRYFDDDLIQRVAASGDRASTPAQEIRERILHRRGAEPVSPEAENSPKMLPYAQLPSLGRAGMGAVSGCYDLLHIGHLRAMASAKRFLHRAGDLPLCLLLLSDENIRRKKGRDRPVLNMNERLALLFHVRAIDWIVCLPEPDGLAAIDRLRPRYFFKSEKDRGQEAVRREIALVRSYGGTVVVVPDGKTVSTTHLIETFRSSCRASPETVPRPRQPGAADGH
jgi:bifunctional ADP-heptose synthase (sugar kinase/adenylyltransferase)